MISHASPHQRKARVRTPRTGLLALAFLMFFTHQAKSQLHLDLSASIASGNTALSALVYDIQTTAYVNSGSITVAGEGNAAVLDLRATEWDNVDFANATLNEVTTLIVRLNQLDQLDATYDGSALSMLENLNHVVFICTVQAHAEQVAAVSVSHMPAGVTSYYTLSVPE